MQKIHPVNRVAAYSTTKDCRNLDPREALDRAESIIEHAILEHEASRSLEHLRTAFKVVEDNMPPHLLQSAMDCLWACIPKTLVGLALYAHETFSTNSEDEVSRIRNALQAAANGDAVQRRAVFHLIQREMQLVRSGSNTSFMLDDLAIGETVKDANNGHRNALVIDANAAARRIINSTRNESTFASTIRAISLLRHGNEQEGDSTGHHIDDIFLCKYMSGYSPAEIANSLNLDVAKVENVLKYAERKLTLSKIDQSE
ncbi:MAG: hypothetical protein U0930_16480 [Pirellulales bacterium]